MQKSLRRIFCFVKNPGWSSVYHLAFGEAINRLARALESEISVN